MKRILFIILSVIAFSSCDSSKKPPVNLSRTVAKNEISVPYSEINGVKTIPVKLNGVSMDMIYDPGCSEIGRAHV